MNSPMNLTRRQFLGRGAGALAAAIAAPTIIPSSALGRDGAVAPSERITMGFIGVGGQGGGHLLGGAWTYVPGGYAARKDVQVLAVCDVILPRREDAKAKVNQRYAEANDRSAYKSCEAYTDFREVLDRADIDAVLVATPAHWHATMASMAARAGKDIYCEKPTACTVSESKAVLAAVRRYGRVYQAGTQQRSEYNGNFRRACEFIRSGRIGQLKEIYSYRDGGALLWPTQTGAEKPIPAGWDWDLYLGPMPWFPCNGNWGAHSFDFGELNWAQHHFDIVQWCGDFDKTGPVEAFVEGGHSHLRYANGVVAYGKPHPEEGVGGDGGACFVGTAGRIAVDRGALISHPEDIVREPLRPGEVHLEKPLGHSDNFLDCVRTRKRTMCDADSSHRAASAMLLSGMAKQLGRTLKWDPDKEGFLDDDEATRMLSMAHRAPWQA